MDTTHPSAAFQRHLQAHTAGLHRQAEACLLGDEIMAGRLSLPRYKALLHCHFLFHAALEGQVGQMDGFPAGYDLEARRKLAALRGLGVAHTGPAPALFAGWDAPRLVGACYVAEGATLGGNVIRRQLAANPAVAASAGGFHYYGVYGAQAGLRWRAFGTFLDAYTPGHEAALLEGAVRAFGIYLAFEL